MRWAKWPVPPGLTGRAMAWSGNVWGAGKLLALVAALAVTFVVSFGTAMRLALKAREVTVPPLVGRTVNDASSMLAELGLALRVEEGRRVHAQIPPGHVVAQDPPAGVLARRPRGVKVWLSDGPTARIVPVLVGEAERSASVRLTAAGLRVGDVAEVRSASQATGVVVAQAPPAGTRSDVVSLLVNRGAPEPRFVMPDLIGLEGERAAGLLRARGFRVTLVGSQPYPGLAPGVVIRQQPAGGFKVAPGDPISLEVSR